MAYTPKTWVNGEVITAEALNNLEKAAADYQVGPPGPQGPPGNVMFATFTLDPDSGSLIMHTPDGYMGPVFSLSNGYLEVSIDG